MYLRHSETRVNVVPNAPGGDWEALRSLALLQHVRRTRSGSNYIYHLVAAFAAILVRCLLVNKSSHRRTCPRSRYLRSMGQAPHTTPPKSTLWNSTPISLNVQTVRSDKHQRRGC